MKYNYFYFLCLLFFLAACNSPADEEKEEGTANDLDATRSFIQASLRGNYSKARDYMLQDPVNEQHLDAVSRVQLSTHEKQGLWDASINIHSRKLINDSTSIIIFSNSFHRENTDTLKVVRKDGKWQVDFKFLFDHNQEDAANAGSLKKDSL